MTKARKTATILGTVVLCVIAGGAVLMLVFSLFANSGRPLFGGVRPMVVLSGSMEPAMPVGSVIITRSVDTNDLEVGDIITYSASGQAADPSNPLVTHRISRIIDDGSGRRFITKGDANQGEDLTAVAATQVAGRVAVTIPYLGRITRFVRTPAGLIVLILLPAAILVFGEVRNIVKGRSKPVQGGGTIALVLCLAVAGAVFGGTNTGTTAFFSDEFTISNMTITAGTWEEEPPPTDGLVLTPGHSKAVRPSDVPPGPACFPIASVDESGQMSLDFGEVNPGNSNNSPDVFRIKNLTTIDVEIDLVARDGFEAFVGRIRLGHDEPPTVLHPGEERSVEIKLDVPRDAEPGDYSGTIRMTWGDESEAWDIPVILTVTDRGKGHSKDPPDSPDSASEPELDSSPKEPAVEQRLVWTVVAATAESQELAAARVAELTELGLIAIIMEPGLVRDLDPDLWVVSVGTFDRGIDAEELLTQLLGQGFTGCSLNMFVAGG